jgi:hypothetical protein
MPAVLSVGALGVKGGGVTPLAGAADDSSSCGACRQTLERKESAAGMELGRCYERRGGCRSR